MSRTISRVLAGLLAVVVLLAIVGLAIGLFADSFTKTVPVTVIADRAGLVMNPDAKVKMRGVEVGRVESITSRPDGRAELRLAMNPELLHLIPANVNADIAASTVFGAKYVQLSAPADPSPQRLAAGHVLQGDHVTVEINTVFQQLTQVLDKIDPVKLNETLGAMSQAVGGRGEKMGQALSDLDALVAKLEPSLPNLERDITLIAPVAGAYGDAAADLIGIMNNTIRVGNSIVDEQHNLDAFLVSMTGLADTGNDVVGGNREALTTVLDLLLPTTDLLSRYHEALNCALGGMLPLLHAPELPNPGVAVSVTFGLGIDRYRYPSNLPKVAASGGPQCMGLPVIPRGSKAPYLVTDTNSNPWQYGNQGIVLNSDGLKQLLFGPIEGPPRNTAQIGQPG